MFQYEKFILEFPSLLHEDRILHAYLHQSETQRERQRERDTLLSTTEPDNHTTLSQLSLLGIFSPFSYSRLLFYPCLLHWSMASDYLGNWLLHWSMVSDYLGNWLLLYLGTWLPTVVIHLPSRVEWNITFLRFSKTGTMLPIRYIFISLITRNLRTQGMRGKIFTFKN